MSPLVFAVVVIALIVAGTVWLQRRGFIVFDSAYQAILAFLRGMLGG